LRAASGGHPRRLFPRAVRFGRAARPGLRPARAGPPPLRPQRAGPGRGHRAEVVPRPRAPVRPALPARRTSAPPLHAAGGGAGGPAPPALRARRSRGAHARALLVRRRARLRMDRGGACVARGMAGPPGACLRCPMAAAPDRLQGHLPRHGRRPLDRRGPRLDPLAGGGERARGSPRVPGLLRRAERAIPAVAGSLRRAPRRALPLPSRRRRHPGSRRLLRPPRSGRPHARGRAAPLAGRRGAALAGGHGRALDRHRGLDGRRRAPRPDGGVSPVRSRAVAGTAALVAGSLAVACLLVEGALRLEGYEPPRFRNTARVVDSKWRALLDCYPTNPRGYFDLDLRDEKTRERYRWMAPVRLDAVARRAPWAVEFRYNALRFRDVELGPKPPGVRRVMVLGDSFTEGQG